MKNYWDDLINRALQEDIGSGDHSSNSSIPENTTGKMQLIVKEDGIIAGIEVAKRVFEIIDPQIYFKPLLTDGSAVKKGDIAFTLNGNVRAMLLGERLSLNLMQRMSGIASYTSHLAQMISHTKTKVLDTRKTTPNLRFLEKTAVKIGGGENHRFGLYDMIMLKDNHIDFAGGIEKALKKANDYIQTESLDIGIEIETRSIKEVELVISLGGVQRIMFDNFSVIECKAAVELVNGKFETEASGGINESTLVAYAETGVDFVSMGALTHSVKSLDMSLKAF